MSVTAMAGLAVQSSLLCRSMSSQPLPGGNSHRLHPVIHRRNSPGIRLAMRIHRDLREQSYLAEYTSRREAYILV